MDLLELAERCEKAPVDLWNDSDHFELNRDIHTLCGDYDCGDDEIPQYTASLDAAMTLVPEGCELRIEQRASKGMRPAYASIWWPGARDIDFHGNGHGQTLATALCAAALRVKACSDTSEEEK